MLITKIRFHWQTFIIYKNGENLKILIEIFREKLSFGLFRPSET